MGPTNTAPTVDGWPCLGGFLKKRFFSSPVPPVVCNRRQKPYAATPLVVETGDVPSVVQEDRQSGSRGGAEKPLRAPPALSPCSRPPGCPGRDNTALVP